MAVTSGGLSAVSAGLDVLSGIYGFLASDITAGMANSRANMIRMEAEANAQRYSEQAAHFLATQKMSYVKSGVEISGSPLDVLSETVRISQANIAAIRAGGAAAAFDETMQGVNAQTQGRAALIGGITGGAVNISKGMYWGSRNTGLGSPHNNLNPSEMDT